MSSRTEREKRRGAIEEIQDLVADLERQVKNLRERADLIEGGTLAQLRNRQQMLEQQEKADNGAVQA